MSNKNILYDFWRYVERQDTKIAKKVYDWLDKDNLASIIVSNDVYWLEFTTSRTVIPGYVFNYIKNWCKKQGYEYLYFKYPVK